MQPPKINTGYIRDIEVELTRAIDAAQVAPNTHNISKLLTWSAAGAKEIKYLRAQLRAAWTQHGKQR